MSLYKESIKLSMVVPCLNESENLTTLIPNLIAALAPLAESYQIIVVDNGSTDDTYHVACQLSARYSCVSVVTEERKGFGRALLKGLDIASGSILGYIHADNQMDPSVVYQMYRKLVKDNVGMCKATRINRSDGSVRWLISKVYNIFFRLLFSTHCKDINGSPKLFRRTFLQKAQLQSFDWFIDAELVIKALTLEVGLSEYPIRTSPRSHGLSQVRVRAIFEFIINMIRYLGIRNRKR